MSHQHGSVEIAQQAALSRMGLEPVIDFGMRLGEGTGAAITMNVADTACAIIQEMASFEEAGVTIKIRIARHWLIGYLQSNSTTAAVKETFTFFAASTSSSIFLSSSWAASGLSMSCFSLKSSFLFLELLIIPSK